MIVSDSSKLIAKHVLVKQVNFRNEQPEVQAICPFELGPTNLAVLVLILQIIFLVVCLHLMLLKDVYRYCALW